MNLVFAFDGSDSSQRALGFTKKFAKDINAKVYVVTSLIGGSASDIDSIDEAKKQMEFAEGTLTREGILCEKHLLVRGLEPGEDIVDFANEIHADFVVVGIFKTSRVEKAIFGSTAQRVILESPCPVITVK